MLINYYKYRKYNGKNDHGIFAGSYLFDSFCKNYEDAKNGKLGTVGFTDNSLENEFIVKIPGYKYDLIFNEGILDHFAIVAQTIMCHNVWNINTENDFKEKIEEYINNKLRKLIIGEGYNGKKVNLQKWPLLFFLDLLDSIEPIKSFPDHDHKSVLENISINYEPNSNKLIIKANPKVFCIKDFYKWTEKIKDLENWMDLKVENITSDPDEIFFEIKFVVNNNLTNLSGESE